MLNAKQFPHCTFAANGWARVSHSVSILLNNSAKFCSAVDWANFIKLLTLGSIRKFHSLFSCNKRNWIFWEKVLPRWLFFDIKDSKEVFKKFLKNSQVGHWNIRISQFLQRCLEPFHLSFLLIDFYRNRFPSWKVPPLMSSLRGLSCPDS